MSAKLHHVSRPTGRALTPGELALFDLLDVEHDHAPAELKANESVDYEYLYLSLQTIAELSDGQLALFNDLMLADDWIVSESLLHETYVCRRPRS